MTPFNTLEIARDRQRQLFSEASAHRLRPDNSPRFKRSDPRLTVHTTTRPVRA